MTWHTRGDPRAGKDCRLCGRPLMAHAVTEFCKDGLTRPGYVSPEQRLWQDYWNRRMTEKDLKPAGQV